MSLITLLTDFGFEDEYVGVCKGVILGRNPEAKIVDLSHAVDPQDIYQAAYLLKAAYSYFPTDTIHMAVVDPGVGSNRAILAARFANQVFLAPDNGLLTGVWGGNPPELLVRIENTDLYLKPVSHSFQGRDIFAPIAAHLSLGMDINELGPTLARDQAVTLTLPAAESQDDDRLRGQVIAIDHFGNLVTNISATIVARVDPKNIVVRVGHQTIVGLSTSYFQAGQGQALALIGSRQLLEIAVNQANAAEKLHVSKGDTVFITFQKTP